MHENSSLLAALFFRVLINLLITHDRETQTLYISISIYLYIFYSFTLTILETCDLFNQRPNCDHEFKFRCLNVRTDVRTDVQRQKKTLPAFLYKYICSHFSNRIGVLCRSNHSHKFSWDAYLHEYFNLREATYILTKNNEPRFPPLSSTFNQPSTISSSTNGSSTCVLLVEGSRWWSSAEHTQR